MRNMLRGFFLVSSVVALFGCVRMTVMDESSKTFTPVQASDVVVYRSVEEAPASYERVAVLRAEEPFTFTDDEAAIVRKAKKKAASLGANGLILGSFQEPTNRVIVLSVPQPFVQQADVYAPPPPSMDPSTCERWTDLMAIRTSP